jgi:hypothetical protein
VRHAAAFADGIFFIFMSFKASISFKIICLDFRKKEEELLFGREC